MKDNCCNNLSDFTSCMCATIMEVMRITGATEIYVKGKIITVVLDDNKEAFERIPSELHVKPITANIKEFYKVFNGVRYSYTSSIPQNTKEIEKQYE